MHSLAGPRPATSQNGLFSVNGRKADLNLPLAKPAFGAISRWFQPEKPAFFAVTEA